MQFKRIFVTAAMLTVAVALLMTEAHAAVDGLAYRRHIYDTQQRTLRPAGSAETAETLPAGNVLVHVLEVDLGKLRLVPFLVDQEFDSSGKRLASVPEVVAGINQFADRPKPIVAAINGGLFNDASGTSMSRVFERPGQRQRWVSASSVASANPKEAQARQTRMQSRSELRIDDQPQRQTVQIVASDTNDATQPTRGGRQLLVLGGGGELLPSAASTSSMKPDNVTSLSPAPDPYHKTPRARTAVGFASAAPDRIVLVTADERVTRRGATRVRKGGLTIAQLADVMSKIHVAGRAVDHAMAFDGGGSTTMVVEGKTVSVQEKRSADFPGRKAKTMLLVMRRTQPAGATDSLSTRLNKIRQKLAQSKKTRIRTGDTSGDTGGFGKGDPNRPPSIRLKGEDFFENKKKPKN